MTPIRIAIIFLLWTLPASVKAQEAFSDAAAELRRLHERLIEAHLNGDVASWMAIEADSIVSANRGRLTFPPADERRRGRAEYLENATFERYRDMREPIVHVSDDSSLGWLIAEVEIVGTYEESDGTMHEIDEVWAWIELYRRTDEGWKLVGNVSNSRPRE